MKEKHLKIGEGEHTDLRYVNNNEEINGGEKKYDNYDSLWEAKYFSSLVLSLQRIYKLPKHPSALFKNEGKPPRDSQVGTYLDLTKGDYTSRHTEILKGCNT